MFASHDGLGLHDILWGYAGLVASVFWWLRACYRPSSARVSLDGSVFVQQTSGSIRGGHAPHQYARHLRFLLTKYVSRGLVSYARQCVAGQRQGRVQQVFEACMSYHSSHAHYIMRKRQRERVIEDYLSISCSFSLWLQQLFWLHLWHLESNLPLAPLTC